MIRALRALDKSLRSRTHILIGGGAAMLLAYNIPLTTMDIDGLIIDSVITPAELDPLVKKIAERLKINPHWFSSHFDAFTYTIPSDYKKRLVSVYDGEKLKVSALSLEDLLIMKCFAGREKDIGHARAIIRKKIDIAFVEKHMEKLLEKGLPGAERALDFLDELKEQVGL